MTSTKPLSHWKRFSPVAYRTWDETQSTKQGWAIRGVANSQRINADRACLHLFGCKADDLNKQASATFLDWLKAQPMQEHPSEALRFCPIDSCQHLQTERGGQVSCSNGHSFEIINRPLNDHQAMVM